MTVQVVSQRKGKADIGSKAGTVIGGVAGAYFGGPMGAVKGASLGSSVGGMVGGAMDNKENVNMQQGMSALDQAMSMKMAGQTPQGGGQQGLPAAQSTSGIDSTESGLVDAQLALQQSSPEDQQKYGPMLQAAYMKHKRGVA
jgi:hypothetical protein